jgi:hypothetical protein
MPPLKLPVASWQSDEKFPSNGAAGDALGASQYRYIIFYRQNRVRLELSLACLLG